MMPEIGSEFWDVPLAGDNNLFPENTEWFLSGRNALQAIIAENHFRSAAIPQWCCDSIVKPFVDAGISVVFYDDDLPQTDAALIMDFFGYERRSQTPDFHGTIIRDTTHSFSVRAYDDADYYFGSLRKWAGFWTGGYGWGFKKPISFQKDTYGYTELRKKAMQQKKNYIDMCLQDGAGISAEKPFLQVFGQAEMILEDPLPILPADPRDIEYGRCFDVESIRRRRRLNAAILLDAFSDIAVFPELKEHDCPLFVPVLVPDRDGLRRHLIQHGIFCPVHWPITKYHRKSVQNQLFIDSELSLVCDQRYSEDDMKRMISIIKEYKEMS